MDRLGIFTAKKPLAATGAVTVSPLRGKVAVTFCARVLPARPNKMPPSEPDSTLNTASSGAAPRRMHVPPVGPLRGFLPKYRQNPPPEVGAA